MKTQKIVFWVVTGLLSAMMLMSAGMYFFNTDEVYTIFESLGFPTFVVYPLAVAKILGVVAILTRKSRSLTEWAYAGFFFDFILAAAAHLNASDGEHIGAFVALVLLAVSYFLQKKVFR
ncbi:MAG: DoxX family protein [Bacteroidota bacterium]